ncbi:hypothetical protein [Streptomyces mirabilis]|uniref:hypothetical protein n=1 Tax=Streptomyces mirabilis TaxID=68239 RepID=UPI0036C5E35B
MTHVPPSPAAGATDTTGTNNSPAPAVQPRHDAQAERSGTPTQMAVDNQSFCSGMATQGCSAAGVGTVELVPPAKPAVDHVPLAPARAVAGRDVPGATVRAPPDLTLLSRLLL